MPWKVVNVSEHRLVLCHAVRTLGREVAAVAREMGVSRKTAYKWLRRFDASSGGLSSIESMSDRSTRPLRSPARVGDSIERAMLEIRDRHGWGPRKIHAVMRRENAAPLPCLRTVANVLRRRGRVTPVPTNPPAVQRFEREHPNELWQIDHKGPVQVARTTLVPFTVIDDHSRYALAFEPLIDKTMARCWDVLWNIFGDVGLPQAILSDNAFNPPGGCRPSVGLSWFDARCIRLNIKPIHGRPYHPQTQGKVEALHATAVRELINRHARRDHIDHFAADCQAWRQTYNTLRPHEALHDAVPATRWRPSECKRPAKLPDVHYPHDADLRKVCSEGSIRVHSSRILVGRGIAGDWVRVEQDQTEVRIFYAWKQVRCLRGDELVKGIVL